MLSSPSFFCLYWVFIKIADTSVFVIVKRRKQEVKWEVMVSHDISLIKRAGKIKIMLIYIICLKRWVKYIY